MEGKAVTGLGEMMTGSQGCRLRSRARVRRECALREVQGRSVSAVAYARRPGAVRVRGAEVVKKTWSDKFSFASRAAVLLHSAPRPALRRRGAVHSK